MSMRAMLVAGLLVSGAAAAMEYETSAADQDAFAASARAGVPGTEASGKRKGRAAVARWDGKVVDEGETVRGLRPEARDAIETWRKFAVRRGYRIDLDESQQILVVSDANRFQHFSASANVVERALEALEPFSSPSEAPLVVLRARSDEDASGAVKAAESLGFATQLSAYVEEGDRVDRRRVDARLAEAVVRLQLSVEEPFLSEWMADGLASYLAQQTTGRALVDGELRTLRSVQSEVARNTGDRDTWRVSLYEISGVRLEGKAHPMEPDAMAIMAYLDRYHTDALTAIVAECGRRGPTDGRPKYREEERSLERQLGKTALDELSRALREGRGYRP